MNRVRELLKLPAAESGIDGAGVRVAVLDTGVDATHLDLSSTLSKQSRSLDTLDRRLLDEVGHGTHVAGIIAGSGTASAGLYRGVAPGVELIALRVGTTDRAISDTVAAAVEVAVASGAHIINYSAGSIAAGLPPPWAWPTRRRALDKAFERATQSGVLCVSAAGNDGPNPATVVPPGVYREVLAVGSMGADGIVADGSSRGPAYFDPTLRKGQRARYDSDFPGAATRAPYCKPDVVAPGGHFRRHVPDPYRVALLLMGVFEDGVVSCRSNDGKYPGLAGDRVHSRYALVPGTSMAAAIMSGLAALAIQYADSLGLDWGENRATALRNLLCKAARPLVSGTAEDYGHGAVFWPSLAGLIEDCVEDDAKRDAVLRGPQLGLVLGDQPDA